MLSLNTLHWARYLFLLLLAAAVLALLLSQLARGRYK